MPRYTGDVYDIDAVIAALKPCPFCGASGKDLTPPARARHSTYVGCNKCDTFGPTADAEDRLPDEAAIRAAIEAWNERYHDEEEDQSTGRD